MEPWILYSLIGATFVWFVKFYWKIIAEKKLNKNRVLIYSMFVFTVFSLVFLATNFRYAHLSLFIVIVTIIRVISGLEKHIFIVESLKNIETWLFFPTHTIIHIFLVFIIGMIFFNEYLSFIQVFALFLWIWVVFLLSDKKSRNIQLDYKKGFLFLFISNIFALISSTINKYIAYIDFDIPTYMLISGLAGTLYLSFTKKDIFDAVDKDVKIKEMRAWFSRGFFAYVWYFSIVYALKDWPFALVQMLLTLSVFIPIFLSVIIFDEKLSKRKIFAFSLFVLVVYLISI